MNCLFTGKLISFSRNNFRYSSFFQVFGYSSLFSRFSRYLLHIPGFSRFFQDFPGAGHPDIRNTKSFIKLFYAIAVPQLFPQKRALTKILTVTVTTEIRKHLTHINFFDPLLTFAKFILFLSSFFNHFQIQIAVKLRYRRRYPSSHL